MSGFISGRSIKTVRSREACHYSSQIPTLCPSKTATLTSDWAKIVSQALKIFIRNLYEKLVTCWLWMKIWTSCKDFTIIHIEVFKINLLVRWELTMQDHTHRMWTTHRVCVCLCVFQCICSTSLTSSGSLRRRPTSCSSTSSKTSLSQLSATDCAVRQTAPGLHSTLHHHHNCDYDMSRLQKNPWLLKNPTEWVLLGLWVLFSWLGFWVFWLLEWSLPDTIHVKQISKNFHYWWNEKNKSFRWVFVGFSGGFTQQNPPFFGICAGVTTLIYAVYMVFQL